MGDNFTQLWIRFQHWLPTIIFGIYTIATLILQGRRLKTDSEKVNGISEVTSDIKPKIDNIDCRTEKQMDKLDVIVSEVEYRKRLHSDLSSVSLNPDILLSQMNRVFEENARLNQQLTQEKLRVAELTAERNALRSEVERLTRSAERSSRQSNTDQEFEYD